MENAEMKVIRIGENNVIVTSEPYVFSGFYDDTKGNGTINGMGKSAFRSYMNSEGKISTSDFATTQASSNGITIAMNTLFDTGTNANAGDTVTSSAYQAYNGYFNGTFIWNGSSFTKQ